MSKAITGIAEIGGVVGLFAANVALGGALSPFLVAALPELMGIAASGVAMEAGAIADALTQNRGMDITTRQPASPRQIIYGTQRVGGTIIYQSTTGSHHDQFNFIIVLATHQIHAIENLYLDGRRVYFAGGVGNSTRNGYNFGGQANGNTYTGPNGQKYNFGGKVYCEARYGDQAEGDVIGGMTANDPNWAAGSNGSPWVGGCCYVYLKIEYDPGTFPQLPEIKFTVHGRDNIYDPRTGTTGYSENPALIAANIITDSTWGAGDDSVNQAQLIAAANICDEQVAFSGGGGGTESRYACHTHYDTTTAVGDALTSVLSSCGGRLSRIGGEWYIWPAAWTAPSSLINATADQSLFIDSFVWTPKKSLPELYNRVGGTYTAPNVPWNISGDLYDSNGWYEGSIQNNFPFAFQPTSFPQYAADELHGYGTGVDVYLTQDGGIELPCELNLSCVLSVSQAQRLAKITLMRNRQQGSADMAMSLAALQLQPTDVAQFNYAPYSWVNKYFEVQKLTLHTDYGNGAPRTYVKVSMGETDPSVYEWSEAEELTVYDVPSAPGAVPYIVDPPTNLAIEDDATTASVLSDGTTIPRMLVTWTPPEDTYVNNGGKIEVQYQFSTLNTSQNGGTSPLQPLVLSPTQQTDGSWLSAWVDAGSVSGQSTFMYVNGISIAQYQNISVQVRAVRTNGAASDWVQVSNALSNPVVTFPISPVGGGGPIFRFPDGKTLDTLEPLEAGADVTSTHTAADTSNVNGVASHLISPISTLMPAQAGADVTAQNKSLAISVPDNRSVNEPPSYYRALGPGIYTEMKTQSVIVGPGTFYFVSLYTEVQWHDTTAGPVIQWYTEPGSNNQYTRTGSGDDSSWGAWIRVQAGADVTSQNTSLQTSNLNNHTLDNLGDGTSYARVAATNLNGNQIDLSLSYLNKTLDHVSDGAARYAAAEAGANVTAGHVLTAKASCSNVSLPISSTIAGQKELTGLGFAAQTASSGDTYNISGMLSFEDAVAGGTIQITVYVYLDSDTTTNYSGGGVIYCNGGSNYISGSGPFFAVISGLPPGAHTFHVYALYECTSGSGPTTLPVSGFAFCQRIY